jgi:predicted glycoside hydrolase/deacetylase ChbG (UPF0249 family)
MTGGADTPDARRLVVNADDYGFSPGVNRGVLEAHAAGVVSSVSVLVNTPGWDGAAAAALRAAGPHLGVGLHFNLTAGAPLTAGRTLRDRRTGRFFSLAALAVRALAGRLDPAEVAAECAAQLGRLAAAGLAITHLDGHRHVHVLPGVWGPVVATARAHGVAVVRLPLEPWDVNPRDGRAALKKAALALAWRAASGGRCPLRHADRFVGVSLQGRAAFLPRLLAVLDGLPAGTTELMVHPGRPDPVLAQWDRYTAPRAAELAALTSEPVRARFRSGRFRVIHFGALGAAPTASGARPGGRESP